MLTESVLDLDYLSAKRQLQGFTERGRSCAPKTSPTMAVSGNDHVSDGVDKTDGRNGARTQLKKTSPFRWMVGVAVRLCIWYALLTPFFRCPSQLSDLNQSSPRVCKPYLVARSHIEPHLLPYYHIYAAPYVDSARPYVSTINKHVYSPAATFARQNYDKYGAPALDQAWTYGEQQWDGQVAPRLQSAQNSVRELYKTGVDPYVQRAVLVVSPCYEKATAVATSTYGDYIIPLYAQSMPFIGKTYTSGQEVLTTTVMPYAQNSWSSVIYFANSSLWPKITGLYSENVEPQLVKIGQRLASYREGKKLRESTEEVDSTAEEAAHTSSSSAETSRISSAPSSTTSSTETSSVQTSLSPAEKEAQGREKITSDLRVWQQKFAVAAEKGAEDLREQVGDIVGSHIASGTRSHGESLATALDTVVTDGLSTVKSRINSLAESLPQEDVPEDEAKAQDELLRDIKQAAVVIRERAQAMREWHRSFDEELQHRVSTAINSTLDILDSIRDLGLQEIGMRWAYMDAVSYKDWAKYYSLKAQFDDWKSDISKVGLQHGKLEEARNMSNELLEGGMKVAENTAKELARLRDVGKWKIAAREASDDFETRVDSPPALPKPRKEAEPSADGEDTESATEPSSESGGELDSTKSASATASTETDAGEPELGADEEIPTTDQDPPSNDESDNSIPKESAQTASAKSNPIWGVAAAEIPPEHSPMPNNVPDGDGEEHFTDHLQSVIGKAGDNYAEVTRAVGEALLGPSSTPVFGENAASLASDQYTRALSAASTALCGTPLSPGETVSSVVAEQYNQAVAAASSVIYGTPTPTSPLEYVSSVASSRLSEGLNKASAQLAQVQVTVSPTATPGHPLILDAQRRYYEAIGLAHDHYSVFVYSASSAIYGTPTGQVEQMTNKASENWESLVSKASEQIYGTPAPYTQQVLEHVTPKYEAVEELVSEFLVGKEPAMTDQAIDRLHTIYEAPYPASALSTASTYASAFVTNHPTVGNILDSANKQLDNAIEAASIHIYGSPKGTVEKATSAVGSAYASTMNEVSGAIYGKEQSYIDVARGAIDEAYLSAESAINNAIYASPTPTLTKSAVDAAYASVTSAIGEQQIALESATSQLGIAVESAQAQLAKLASSVSSLGSEAVETAASQVEAFTENVKSTPSTRDEL